MYSRNLEKSKQKLKRAKKEQQSNNTSRHIEKYNKPLQRIDEMKEQVKNVVNNYLLANFE